MLLPPDLQSSEGSPGRKVGDGAEKLDGARLRPLPLPLLRLRLWPRPSSRCRRFRRGAPPWSLLLNQTCCPKTPCGGLSGPADDS